MKSLDIDLKEKTTGAFVATLTGPLDTYTHETLEFYLEKILVPSTQALVFNMEGVDYISSMGVGTIFKVRKLAKEHNFEFKMIGLQKPVEKVLATVQAMPPEGIFQSIEEMDEYLNSIQMKAKEDG